MLLANKEEFSAIVLTEKKLYRKYTGIKFPAHLTYACSHRIIARRKFLFSSSSKMVQGKKIKGTDSAAGQRMPTRIYPYLSEDV